MQILEGRVEQDRQRAGGKLNIIPLKAAKLPAACWLILAGLFDMGVSPPKHLKILIVLRDQQKQSSCLTR